MAIQKYDIPYPDGHGFEERYWSPLNTPVLNDGKLLYIIHQVNDVTEKVKTKVKLETQTEILKRTNAELEQFVRISSHDLQVFTTLILFMAIFVTYLERKDVLSAESSDHNEIISTSIENTETIVDRISNTFTTSFSGVISCGK